MNILENIVAFKRKEVDAQKSLVPELLLTRQKQFTRKCFSLSANLTKANATGIIAEFKRKSPSKGFINKYADVLEVTRAYSRSGASGLSVLTDHEFFGGSTEDLAAARVNEIPILRKEFIVDPYQILESKAIGADVILLIAACLSKSEVKILARVAASAGLEILLELHDESELDHICDEITMVGINNRNLKTFEVDIRKALLLAERIPGNIIKVAESGISDIETIDIFREAGYHGFLIGEIFMKEEDPGEALYKFTKKIKKRV